WGVQDEPALAHVLAEHQPPPVAEAAPGEPDPGTPEDEGASAVSAGAPARAADGPTVAAPWGVNVAGFLRAELGIGEAARQALHALDEARIPALPVEGTFVPSSRQGADVAVVGAGEAPYAVNLVCVNPDVLET